MRERACTSHMGGAACECRAIRFPLRLAVQRSPQHRNPRFRVIQLRKHVHAVFQHGSDGQGGWRPETGQDLFAAKSNRKAVILHQGCYVEFRAA